MISQEQDIIWYQGKHKMVGYKPKLIPIVAFKVHSLLYIVYIPCLEIQTISLG